MRRHAVVLRGLSQHLRLRLRNEGEPIGVVIAELILSRSIPSRNLMSPPQLTRDAPLPDVLEPLEIGLLPVLGNEFRAALAHGVERVFREGLGIDVPLIGEIGLEHDAGAITVRDHMYIWFDLVD